MKVAASIALLAALNGNGNGIGARAEPIPLVARSGPSVDLGYSSYQGTFDAASNVNIFKGIRYAAPPLGDLRFAAPQTPAQNRTSKPIPATQDPPRCPQTGTTPLVPAVYGFVSGPGDEDCLFLNVFAPANAKNLPVFFWIHGGGYGLFSASGLDPIEFMATNDNKFVSVVIQYRLGAFGFLPGDDVKAGGALNAGLLDMNFALQWVQKHIRKFGGDPSRVTLAGESAGGGAVIYQSMAYGGKQKQKLFNNIIASSPWIPYQYNYNDAIPSKAYTDFTTAAGCSSASDKLACLRSADSPVLQNASAQVSEAGAFGTFAFVPVTDGTFIQQLPTRQLLSKKLNGKRVLAGNMANEGVPLAPPTIRTLAEFRAYITTTFPNFSAQQKAALERQYAYQGDDRATDPAAPLFDTTGTSSPTAVNQSSFGTGQQQRTANVFAESAFICNAHWFADAMPQAWRYQFSAPPAYHGFDLQSLWSKGAIAPGRGFTHAFQKIWGSFVVGDSPRISVEDAKAGFANATVPPPAKGTKGLIEWPAWDPKSPVLLSLNATGGVPVFNNVTENLKYNVYADPGVTNVFKLADARKWEGGRGERCDWWRSVSGSVPY